jgi:hypothetical protein
MQGRPAENNIMKEDFFMAEFASRGVGAAGLTTGIIGTSLGALNSGILGNLFGGNNCNGGGGHNAPVNRYEMELQQKIAALESGIALRDANIYNDGKVLELYRYVDGKLEAVNAKIAEQATFNAVSTAAQNCMAAQINQLFGLTRLVIPNSSSCPGWGDVTVTPATATGA